MIRLNPTRVDYAEKLRDMIDRYNSGSANIEEFFEQLKLFAQDLEEEEKRAVSQAMTEEELALFDLLTKPDPKLTRAQEDEVKKIAKELLQRLKNELLVLDWKKRQQTRAAVQVAIEETWTPCRLRMTRRSSIRNARGSLSMCSRPIRATARVFMERPPDGALQAVEG